MCVNKRGTTKDMKTSILEKAIASEDYRKYILQTGITLSDWEMASLVYNNEQLFFNDKMETLQLLAKETNDESLRGQLNECILRNKQYLKEFCENNEMSYYQLSIWWSDDYCVDGIYRDYESAYSAGWITGECFKISKEMFACMNKRGEDKGVLGTVEINSDGSLGRGIWLYDVEEDISVDVGGDLPFWSRNLCLPLFYVRGDIVKIVGTGIYGIVESETNNAAEVAGRGYGDFTVRVNTIYDGDQKLTTFSHKHISPALLEYAKLDEEDARKGFLERMRISMLCNTASSEIGRDCGRIPAVLSKIEEVWNQYPDVCLGQLLLNVCGTKDLLGVDDEELIECFEKNRL